MELSANRRLVGDGQEMAERIDHHVANKEDSFLRTAFLEQMFGGVFFGYEQVVSQSVGQDAIDLFGHGAVKAAQSSLHMRHANAELHGGERDGNRGVHVTNDQYEVGLLLDEDGLNTF